ncbi:MAG: hypothetical protein ABI743_12160, partial [bacterium]
MTTLPTAPLRTIHAALLDDLALLRRQVAALPGLDARAAMDVMDAVKSFIIESIRPRAEWEEATADLPVLAGAYFPEDFAALQEAGLLELISGPAE